MPVIQMEHATVGHPGAWQLGPIDLSVERGSFWGVVGPNGAGKTTMLRSMVGLLPLISGRCYLSAGAEKRGGVSYVPQRDSLDSVFPVTALNVAMMGLVPRLGFGRPFRWKHRRLALDALDRTGMRKLASEPFRQLSGGEQQRVLIARATASDPAVMLLDEPTAAMDVDAEREVLDLIDALAKEHDIAVLMVSHSLHAVRQHAERVILLNQERQRVQVGTPQEIITSDNVDEQTFRTASALAHMAVTEEDFIAKNRALRAAAASMQPETFEEKEADKKDDAPQRTEAGTSESDEGDEKETAKEGERNNGDKDSGEGEA